MLSLLLLALQVMAVERFGGECEVEDRVLQLLGGRVAHFVCVCVAPSKQEEQHSSNE